jgi:hypothetical protein
MIITPDQPAGHLVGWPVCLPCGAHGFYTKRIGRYAGVEFMSVEQVKDTPFERFQYKTLQIACQTNLELPNSYYRYAPCQCWKCHKEILVFTWPGQEMHSDIPPGKPPTPPTLRYEFSRTVGSHYWVNTCPYCKVIQGDFFLYIEPDGPFFAFKCGDDSPEAFRQDLMKLADYADYIGNL